MILPFSTTPLPLSEYSYYVIACYVMILMNAVVNPSIYLLSNLGREAETRSVERDDNTVHTGRRKRELENLSNV